MTKMSLNFPLFLFPVLVFAVAFTTSYYDISDFFFSVEHKFFEYQILSLSMYPQV